MAKRSNEFKNGYGQCKADILQGITEALDLTQDELFYYKPDPVQAKDLKDKILALRWARALIKGL